MGDIKGQQSTESAPSPDVSQDEKQEKVFKKRQGSFRRTFSLKSFSQRLQRGSTSGSKSSLSESVTEDDEDATQKKPKGLHRVGTMPAMRLGQRRKTMDSVTSDDSWSSQREDREGGLWGVVKSRVGIGSFNFSRQNSQGSSSSIDALAPPKHAAHDHDNVDAVYQVLKQGALLRATEKNEEDDPILAARREKLSAQNSVDTKEADSSSNTEASSETTVVKSSSSSSSIKTSVVTKPPLSSKSQASVTSVSSSEKTETISIESKQKKVQQTKTTKAEKGFYTYNGMIGASNKGPDFGDIVFKVLDNRGGD